MCGEKKTNTLEILKLYYSFLKDLNSYVDDPQSEGEETDM